MVGRKKKEGLHFSLADHHGSHPLMQPTFESIHLRLFYLSMGLGL